MSIEDMIHPAIRAGTFNKYAPKLSHADRCAALGLIRLGYSTTIVAAVFKLNRRTVAHISNSNGTYYKAARDEYTGLGHDEFIKRYVTEHHMKRANEVVNTKVSNLTTTEDADDPQPNKRAKARAGTHMNDTASWQFAVSWESTDRGTGWYWRIDGTSEWLGDNHGLPFATSAAAYKFAMEQL